jgi:imidazolonepropionase
MLIIRNIGELVVVPPGPIGGRSMNQVERIANAALLVENGRIKSFGPESSVCAPAGCEVIDAKGGCVVPGLIDCHTHAVFAGTREKEFAGRCAGKSYAQIAEEGGGIRTTVEAVREATLEHLVALAEQRLARMLQNGVTTVEIKSGYGLTVEDELKMLEAIRTLRDLQPIDLVATYLAAHTVPKEFEGRAEEYLDAILDEALLARIRDEQLAEFCDVFCEKTAFGLEQSRRVLTTAARLGLRSKIHADQITQIGASTMAGEVGAISADHLETIDDRGIESLKAAGTVAVLLPGCSFFLGVDQAPARLLLEADLPVAVATDFNPGSAMIESLPLVMSIACTQMKMTPTEVLIASTANAAAALDRHTRVGSLEEGFDADLLILDTPNFEQWLWQPGRNCVATVIKSGRVVGRAG